jgi:hypothetical protein
MCHVAPNADLINEGCTPVPGAAFARQAEILYLVVNHLILLQWVHPASLSITPGIPAP